MQRNIVLLLFVLTLFQMKSANPETRVLLDGGKGIGVLSQYGTNFGFFMPETGGYLYTGLISGDKSIWLNEAKKCEIEKLDKGWIVTVADSLLGEGELKMHVLPLSACNGLIIELTCKNIPENLQFLWAYGGCSANTEPSEKTNFFQLEQCLDNVFNREINAFTVYYGSSYKLKVMMGIAPLETKTRLSDANKLTSPLEFWNSGKKTYAPAMSAMNALKAGKAYYYCIYHQNQEADYNYFMLPDLFKKELTTKNAIENEETHSNSSFGPDFHF